jgi:hypothetical protein
MSHRFILKCPDCEGKFPWEGEWPRFCPLCRADMSLPDDGALAVPAFLTKSKHVDRVYRDMERGSEIRQSLAADMLGVDKSEVSDLKITDLNDARHPGEVAAKELPVNNDVTRRMDEMRARGMPVGFQDGSSFMGSGGVGPVPNAGARMMTQMENLHGKISHMPSREYVSPGYQRRG